MKVRCVKTNNYSLTLNKDYIVVENGEGIYYLLNDNGNGYNYPKSLFKEIKESNDMKVKYIESTSGKWLTRDKEYKVVSKTAAHYNIIDDTGTEGRYSRSRFAEVNVDMKKSDLKTGMVVETRDNELYVVFKDAIFDDSIIGTEHNKLDSYEENLKNKYFSNLDIVKIYNTYNYGVKAFFKNKDKSYLTLIWTRKDNSEEIAKTRESIAALKVSLTNLKERLTKLEREV